MSTLPPGPCDAWPTRSFAEHTVVCALGMMTHAVVRRALALPEVVEALDGWLGGLTPGVPVDPHPISTMSFRQGFITLLARPRPGEFLVQVRHPCHRSVIAVGQMGLGAEAAHGPDHEGLGVLVAGFEGDASCAAAFAHALVRRLDDVGIAAVGAAGSLARINPFAPQPIEA